MARDGRRGTPVESDDGRRYVSIMEAARAIVARDGCGNAKIVHRNIIYAIHGGGTAYGLKWRYIEDCAGCAYSRVPGTCPIRWSWPEYPEGTCRRERGGQ